MRKFGRVTGDLPANSDGLLIAVQRTAGGNGIFEYFLFGYGFGRRFQPARASFCPAPRRCSRLRLYARHTKVHSVDTLTVPRRRNCLKPRTDLMIPNPGSTVCWRSLYVDFSQGEVDVRFSFFGKRYEKQRSVFITTTEEDQV